MARPPLKDTNSTQGLIGLGPIPGQAPVAAFNNTLHESLLETKGFEAYHYRHAVNPDRETLRGGVNPNQQSSSLRGVRFYSARKVAVIPQQFRLEDRLTVQGLWGVGSVLLNVSGNYIDMDRSTVHIRPRDLIVLNPSITSMTDQLIEYNPAGINKLHYRAKGIDYISDAAGRVYEENVDFEIYDGGIRWLQGGKKPNFIDGKGDILTVVYYYTPIYVVQNLPHSLRILPANNIGHGALPREAIYAPQLVVAKPSTLVEEKDILDWSALPPYQEYPRSENVTGG